MKKWTKEILDYIRARTPLPEHGYTGIQMMVDEINKVFGTCFTRNALAGAIYENGIKLGFFKSRPPSTRTKPVGSLSQKKGYIRIKVAEPNKWMQYQRYIWEKHHPGQSAEGKIVMFLDSNTRNFNPDNLVCVTRQEMSVMASLGHNKDMTRDEREVILLRAKLSIERSRILGQKKAQALHNTMNYESVKNDPEHIARRKKYARERWERIKADPIKHEEFLRHYREHRRKRKLRRTGV